MNLPIGTTRITSEVHLDATDSTMDAAKALAASQDFLLATSVIQTQGKGTRGRAWQSVAGNIHMTLGINRRHLPNPRLALLPLEIGVHLWEAVAARILPLEKSQLVLKWPNDLMFRGGKVGGVLMETHADFLLVGIGINVAASPPVLDGGTNSACLADAGMKSDQREFLINDIYQRVQIASANMEAFDSESILLQWQGKVDWNKGCRLRDRPGQPVVMPVLINNQGHLQVRHADGIREWLVADYLI